VKRILTDILVQDLKAAVNNGRNAENVAKNSRKINWKKSALLISADFKINLKKIVSKLICLTSYIFTS
jgi:hypothetical protein